jgi:hypothetical protein
VPKRQRFSSGVLQDPSVPGQPFALAPDRSAAVKAFVGFFPLTGKPL